MIALVAYLAGDGTQEQHRYEADWITCQMWDGGRTLIRLLDADRRSLGSAQYARATFVLRGLAAEQYLNATTRKEPGV